jgi:hypothetical protein
VVSGTIGAFWYFMSTISYPLQARPTPGNPQWQIKDGLSGSDVWYYSRCLAASWAFFGFAIGVVFACMW